MTIDLDDYDRFLVAGYYYQSAKRFRHTYPANQSGAMTAFAINLWRGKVWGILKDKRRKLLKTVFN